MTNHMRQGLLRSGVPMIFMLGVLAGCGDDDLGTRYRVIGPRDAPRPACHQGDG